MKIANKSVKLLNAYLDTRVNKSFVRVNVNAAEALETSRDVIFCHFLFERKSGPFVVRAVDFTYMWIEGLKLLSISKNFKI